MGNVARRQGIKCTPLTGAICQPKFQKKSRKFVGGAAGGVGGGCSPVTDGDVLRHLVLHGLVGDDLKAAHERLKRLRLGAGAGAGGAAAAAAAAAGTGMGTGTAGTVTGTGMRTEAPNSENGDLSSAGGSGDGGEGDVEVDDTAARLSAEVEWSISHSHHVFNKRIHRLVCFKGLSPPPLPP